MTGAQRGGHKDEQDVLSALQEIICYWRDKLFVQGKRNTKAMALHVSTQYDQDSNPGSLPNLQYCPK